MKLHSLEQIFHALNQREVRYLVVGGVAVNAYGYQRATHDLDLVLDLARENVIAAVQALGSLGYRPMLPVPAEQFADPDTRRDWHERRHVEVFSMIGSRGSDPSVDMFVQEPFPFPEEYARAKPVELAPGIAVRFVSIEGLIAMKESAGRPRDVDDVEHLRWILEERERDDV
jgi:predicted nucleotidyltransferase